MMTRRDVLKNVGAAGAGWWLAASTSRAAAPGGLRYEFVNRTGGKFADDQCFWSLTGGRDWHSFAAEPTAPCPTGNGRVYLRLGAAPRNLDDRAAIWDFIEYAYGNGTWHGNTTQVDAFCIPLTIELGRQKVGITEPRDKLFAAFRADAPAAFRGCVLDDRWIVSPARAGFGKGGQHAAYFDKYIDEVWDQYARERPTPSGKWTGKVVGGALTFTPVGGGKPVSCARKPTTQEVLLGTGVLGSNPQFCAAINRHVLADPADWHDPAAFYRTEPSNWYSKFFHEHSLGRKAYGFCYDDASDQAAFFSGKGDRLTVTLTWVDAPAGK